MEYLGVEYRFCNFENLNELALNSLVKHEIFQDYLKGELKKTYNHPIPITPELLNSYSIEEIKNPDFKLPTIKLEYVEVKKVSRHLVIHYLRILK
ncbi:MAG: hypothetical protein KDK36_05950 [Leptospiraceae bacterium]|nr:hypothetical protein [Leptospiraceae bacterium]